jgi:cob(I)alamin adenosyltransferase
MTRQPLQRDTTGLFILHTGNGKGKTSAALNLVYRHLAHNKRVVVVQFIKRPQDYDYGDVIMLERLAAQGAKVTVTMLGAGFTWKRNNVEESRFAAREAWQLAATAIADPNVDLVVCDELHIALTAGYLELEPILESIRTRPISTHVVTTGRGAPTKLIETADLVTDFVEVKHPYKSGIRAQPGIEF